MAGWLDGDGWIGMDGWMGMDGLGWVDGDGWMEMMAGWLDGWMDGWTDGGMDGCVLAYVRKDVYVCSVRIVTGVHIGSCTSDVYAPDPVCAHVPVWRYTLSLYIYM